MWVKMYSSAVLVLIGLHDTTLWEPVPRKFMVIVGIKYWETVMRIVYGFKSMKSLARLKVIFTKSMALIRTYFSQA